MSPKHPELNSFSKWGSHSCLWTTNFKNSSPYFREMSLGRCYMCVHVCVYAHLCGGQRLTSGGFFSHSLLFETESLTSPGIHHLYYTGWLVSPWIHFTLPSSQGCRWAWLFTWGLGILTQYSKHYPLSHPPSFREMGLKCPPSMGLYSPIQKFRKLPWYPSLPPS